MRKSRVAEAQIIGILKQAEGGAKVGDLVREHGVSEATCASSKCAPDPVEVGRVAKM